jgi:hypothetical protein
VRNFIGLRNFIGPAAHLYWPGAQLDWESRTVAQSSGTAWHGVRPGRDEPRTAGRFTRNCPAAAGGSQAHSWKKANRPGPAAENPAKNPMSVPTASAVAPLGAGLSEQGHMESGPHGLPRPDQRQPAGETTQANHSVSCRAGSQPRRCFLQPCWAAPVSFTRWLAKTYSVCPQFANSHIDITY